MEAKPPAKAPSSPASETEVAAAIEALYQSPAKLLKLRDYATFKLEGIGLAAEGREAEDLLSEAVTRTLGGERTWNKAAVDIEGHLIGAMRSIASHWAESVSAREAETHTESEVTQVTQEGEAVSQLEQAPSERPGPDRILEAQQQVKQIEQAFKDDEEVTELLEALREGLTGPEIQELLGVSKTEYETRMKRLRRKARTLSEGSGARHA